MKELVRKVLRSIIDLSLSLLKKNRINRKILFYLSEKDWSAEHAVINATFREFGISKEEYVTRLNKLSKKELLEYKRPFGSGSFVRITRIGKNKLKPRSKRALKYLLENWIGLATLFFTIASILFSVWIFNENQKDKYIPFFKYVYSPSEQIFQVTGGDNVDVVKVGWYFVGKWFSDEEKYTLRKVNNLDKELSWLDVRDVYGEALVNTLQQWGKDVMECEFFGLTPDAIPTMVVVTYDTKNTTASSTDLVIITRMDTSRPNAQVIHRRVTDSTTINQFFEDNLWQVKSATEHIQEHYQYSNENYSGNIKQLNGRCGALGDQPLEGY